MCEPVTGTITMASIAAYGAAASAAASVVIAKQQADAQSAANQRQADSTRQAQVDNSNQITMQRGQQTDAASQKINANNTAMREAQATTVAGAGPSGLSVDALIGDMGRKGATYNESVNENLVKVNQSLDNQQTNVNRGAASEINSLKTPNQPDYLGTALKIGSAAYGQYTQSSISGGSGSAWNPNYSHEGTNYPPPK